MQINKHSILRLLGAVLATGALATAAQADPILAYNGNVYYYTSAASSWTAAEAEAISMGGHLVAITDAAEDAALGAAFGTTERLWIGLTDAAAEGVFTWTTGEAFGYSHWSGGEPNGGTVENYVIANWASGGDWNDLPDAGYGTYDPATATRARGIIEVPEPGSLALAGLALAGLAAARRRKV